MDSWGLQVEGLAEVPSLLMAAHELKSPLVLIRQLALQLQEVDDPQAIEQIKLTAEKSLRLVESLTRTARLQDGLFATEPISVSALYDEVAHELQPLARALDQSITVNLPRRPLSVVANPMLLRSIILGLCDNALTHNTDNQPVVLGAKKRADQVELEVRDFGPGIDSLQQISQQFGHNLAPLKNRPRSSGLGLMIARQFAQRMEADLRLTRHRQSGVTFSLVVAQSKQLSLI